MLIPAINLPHVSRYYRLCINRTAVKFELVVSNWATELSWTNGVSLSNTALEFPIPLPPRIRVPVWRVGMLRSLLAGQYYAAIQILSDAADVSSMEIIMLRSFSNELLARQPLYPSLS